jgi:hypothetical protein
MCFGLEPVVLSFGAWENCPILPPNDIWELHPGKMVVGYNTASITLILPRQSFFIFGVSVTTRCTFLSFCPLPWCYICCIVLSWIRFVNVSISKKKDKRSRKKKMMSVANHNNHTQQQQQPNVAVATAINVVAAAASIPPPQQPLHWLLSWTTIITVLVILLIVIAIVSLIWANEWVTQYHNVYLWQDQLASEHQELLRMMDCIHQTLERNHIRYWIHGGTLMGAALRDKKIIRWDDDMDIVVLVPSESVAYALFTVRWKRACQELEASGIAEKGSLPHLVSVHQLCSTLYKKHRLHIDVMFYEAASRNGKLIYQSRSQLYRTFAPGEWYWETEVWPLQMLELNGHKYWGPHLTMEPLLRAYPECHLKNRVQIPHMHCFFPSHTPWSMLATWMVGEEDLPQEMVANNLATLRSEREIAESDAQNMRRAINLVFKLQNEKRHEGIIMASDKDHASDTTTVSLSSYGLTKDSPPPPPPS